MSGTPATRRMHSTASTSTSTFAVTLSRRFAGCLPDPGHLALDAGDWSVNVTQRYINYQDRCEVWRPRCTRRQPGFPPSAAHHVGSTTAADDGVQHLQPNTLGCPLALRRKRTFVSRSCTRAEPVFWTDRTVAYADARNRRVLLSTLLGQVGRDQLAAPIVLAMSSPAALDELVAQVHASLS